MGLRLIAAPQDRPLSLDETKLHLRVDHNDDDTLIDSLIDAAISFVDGEYGFLGRALVTQTWELVLDAFPENEIRIPLPPLQSVLSVAYDDPGGAAAIVPASAYTVDDASEPAWIVPSTSGAWPATFDGINSVRIQFVAGYPPTQDVEPDFRANIPRAIRQAMLLHIGANYEHRENVVVGVAATMVPFAAEQLLRPFRVVVPLA